MKTYKEKNNNKYVYSPISRYIKIMDSVRKGYYIRHYNRRIYLNDIASLHYPIMLEDTDGKTIVLSGYEPLCNTCCLLYEVHPDGEYMRIWQEKTIDD